MRRHSVVRFAKVNMIEDCDCLEEMDKLCDEAVAMKYYDNIIKEIQGTNI